MSVDLLLERLEGAVRACESLSDTDTESYEQKIAEQFIALRTAIYHKIEEKTIILTELEWRKETLRESFRKDIKNILKGEAERISSIYGYNLKTVEKLLWEMNEDKYKEEINVSDIIILYDYEYWTLE